MAVTFLDITITPDVIDVQHEMSSNTLWQTPHSHRQIDHLGDSRTGVTATRDSFYLATVPQSGWPYIQRRDDPVGSLCPLDDAALAITDFGGNHRYIITGNPCGNVRARLFLMDYPCHARLKVYATVEAVAAEDHPQLLVQMTLVNYCAHIERLFLFHLQTFDWNCPRYIMPRYSAQQVAEYSRNSQRRVYDLEQENQRLQQQLASREDSQ